MGANPIVKAIQAPKADARQSATRRRGRPTLSPEDVAIRQLRLEHFGRAMRKLREDAGLSIADASRSLDSSSPRRLLQYEGVCFPPGEIIDDIARTYGVEPEALGKLVLSHSDPDLFEILCHEPAYRPSRFAINARIAKLKPKNDAS